MRCMRPRKTSEFRKTKTVQARVTDSLYRELGAFAEENGIDLADALRMGAIRLLSNGQTKEEAKDCSSYGAAA